MKKHRLLTLVVFAVSILLAAGANAQMMEAQPKQQSMGSMMMGQGMGGGMMGQGMNCCMMGEGMRGGMMEQGMHEGMMGRGMHGGFYLNLARELDLTQAQIKQIQDIKLEFEKGKIQRRAAIEVGEIELQQLKAADNVDLKKVESKIRDVQSKKADLEIAAFQAQMKAKDVLTPEQKSKLEGLSCPLCGGKHGKGMMQPGEMMQHEEDED